MNENDMLDIQDEVRAYLLEDDEVQLVRLIKLRYLMSNGFVPKVPMEDWIACEQDGLTIGFPS